jgi:hypothetical protein
MGPATLVELREALTHVAYPNLMLRRVKWLWNEAAGLLVESKVTAMKASG